MHTHPLECDFRSNFNHVKVGIDGMHEYFGEKNFVENGSFC